MGDDAIDSMEHDWYNQFDDDEETIYIKAEPNKLPFKSIKKETDKAWLLIMTGDAERWFPKSKCDVEGNFIFLPRWLELKMMDDSIGAMAKQNRA